MAKKVILSSFGNALSKEFGKRCLPPKKGTKKRRQEIVGSIKAMVWSLLSGGFMYFYLTGHILKANIVGLIWIAAFSWEFMDSTRNLK